MPRYLVDESVHGEVVRAVLRRRPNVDMLRIQDVGLRGAQDVTILEWAAAEGRIVITSDASTLVGLAYERVRAGQPMPGVFVIAQSASLGRVIEDLLLVTEASIEGEWEMQVRYLPL